MKRLLSALTVCIAGYAAAETKLDAGDWRVKVSSSTNGVADPIDDTTTCLEAVSAEGLATYYAPVLEGTDAKCETTRLPTSGDTFNFKMACTGTGFAMEATTAVTMPSSRAFTMNVKIDTHAQEQHAVVIADATGTWVGPCSPPEETD
jgi:hypothetical protein